jgi:hypothetical protein
MLPPLHVAQTLLPTPQAPLSLGALNIDPQATSSDAAAPMEQAT